jgi:hypothetical protein
VGENGGVAVTRIEQRGGVAIAIMAAALWIMLLIAAWECLFLANDRDGDYLPRSCCSPARISHRSFSPRVRRRKGPQPQVPRKVKLVATKSARAAWKRCPPDRACWRDGTLRLPAGLWNPPRANRLIGDNQRRGRLCRVSSFTS